jgi:hypothetical protein
VTESTTDKRSLEDRIKGKLAEGVTVAGFFLLPVTFLILAAQFIFYLKDGVWPKWVLLFLISSALPIPFLDWLIFPQDWHGLHKIVAWILMEAPLWADALALAFICIFLGDSGKK